MPVPYRQIGRRTSAVLCCLSLAGPASLTGQGLAQRLSSALQPIQTPIGIDLSYGIVVGGTPVFLGRAPHPDQSGRTMLRAAVSLRGQWIADFLTPSRRLFQNGTVSFRASVSQVRQQQFYGFHGQGEMLETTPTLTGIRQTRIAVEPMLTVTPPGTPFRISAGPIVKYTTTRASLPAAVAAVPSHPNSQHFTDGYGQVGAQAAVTAEWRDNVVDPTHGLRVDVGGSVYAPLWDVERPLAEVHAEARGMVRLPPLANATIVLRAGGRQVFGEVPIHEAAYLGGTGTLRGTPGFWYAGSSMLYGGGELRVGVAQPTILGRSLRLGIAGVADAGRVSYHGTVSDWLTSYGGGLWVKPLDSPQVFSAGVVQGPLGPRFYFRTDIGY